MMEAARDYGVRIVRAYGEYSVGQIIFPTGLMRSHLVGGGWCEPVKPQAVVEEPKKKPRARE